MATPAVDSLMLKAPSAAPDYHFVTVRAEDQRFLRAAFDVFGCRTMRVWTEADVTAAAFDRIPANGLVTALVSCGSRTVALAWSDFRVNGASLGKGVARRLSAFLRELRAGRERDIPLVYVVNSAGASLMEGRSVFSDVFQLIPDLLAYAEDHPLLTVATGKCLGLAALLFGLGHYRIAVAGRTQLNLTGPEVISLFFGKGVDFAQQAAAERSHERTELVHELAPSLEAALARCVGIITGEPAQHPQPGAPLGDRSAALLAQVLDPAPLELVPAWCPRVRLFLGWRHGRQVGVFLNPPERSNNMITVRTLQKYAAGLDCFRALKVPVISLLDSPGIDPRFEQGDANLLRQVVQVGAKIVDYPYASMGVVVGRCFGGATTLCFPKVFGSRRTLALRGSRIGTMHGSIVAQVLGGSARLLEQWRAVEARQTEECDDLIADGTLDAVIDLADLGREVDRFLAPRISLVPRAAMRAAR